MSSYTTVLVGTDGSETSLRAVERAAELAADAGATLVIVCAFIPPPDRSTARDQDILGAEAYQVVGSAPAEETLRIAGERASKAGATRIETEVVQGRPADSLVAAVTKHSADVLVVGNRGLNSIAGRIIGSVPLDVVRHSPIDVLIVHTT
jgi:nucleotide-binding universal stress UspA family protein